MVKLTAEEFTKVDVILQRIELTQLKARETLRSIQGQLPDNKDYCGLAYYEGNVGFIKWLRWFLDPNKLQAQKGRIKKRRESNPANSTGFINLRSDTDKRAGLGS